MESLVSVLCLNHNSTEVILLLIVKYVFLTNHIFLLRYTVYYLLLTNLVLRIFRNLRLSKNTIHLKTQPDGPYIYTPCQKVICETKFK